MILLKKYACFLLMLLAFWLFSQPKNGNPGFSGFPYSVNLLTLGNEVIDSTSLTNDGSPLIITYWMTTCKPCIKEHNDLTKRLLKWQKETGVRIISISPERKSVLPRIIEMVRKYGWKHDFYIDYTKRLRNKLLGNWHGVPQTFVFDSRFTIRYHSYGYTQSSLDKIENLLYRLKNS